jgi:beta-lactam-binding protein with PASTA domain
MLPNVLGKSPDQARQMLAPWTTVVELTLTDAASNGRVVEQIPRPTTNLTEREQVTILVGTTNPPAGQRQVPKLLGLSLAEAVAALKKAGFEPVLRACPSTAAERGLVLRQTPQRYSFAAPGAGVKVTVGRGDGAGAGSAPAPAEPAPPAQPEPPPAAPSVPVSPPPGTPPKNAPGPVTLLGPVESENYPRAHGATFEWRTVPNADAYEWELQIQSGTSWKTAQTEKLIGTKFRPARLEAGRYRWRVRALSGENPGAWTDFRALYLY